MHGIWLPANPLQNRLYTGPARGIALNQISDVTTSMIFPDGISGGGKSAYRKKMLLLQ